MDTANTKVMFISTEKILATDGMMKRMQGAAMDPFYVQNAERSRRVRTGSSAPSCTI